MKILFEDNREDILYRLLLSAYNEDVSSKFIFARGNGNIIRIVNEIMDKTSEEICVYLDLVPGNSSALEIYIKLKRLSRKNNYRIIVMPIPCAEYYFIKALFNQKNLITRVDGIKECVDLDYYTPSSLIETTDDKKFCRNFEKYCKLVLKKCFIDCVRHSNINNAKYGMYYTHDCKCEYNEYYCRIQSRLDKCIEVMCKYPCVPGESLIGSSNKRSLNTEEVWEIHRKLVENYNKMVEVYINKGEKYEGAEVFRKYKKISSIK